MTERHLTPLALDELAGTLRPATDVEGAHLASCATCRAAFEEIRGYRERFAREILPRTRDAVEARVDGRRRPWLALVLAPLACAAVVALVLRPQGVDFAAKGAPTFKAFAHRGAEVSEVRDGDVLRAGDQLRFEVQPGGLRYLVIASIDSQGGVAVIHPREGQRSAEIDPNTEFVMPGSIALDDARGPERAFVLLSRQPFPVAPVESALRALGGRGPGAIRTAALLPGVAAESQLSIVWEKAAP